MLCKIALSLAAMAAVIAVPSATAQAVHRVGVVIAPPPVLMETVPPPPFPDAVWVEGYWDPILGVWVPGHHVHARPGFVYVPHRWARAPYGWRYVRGYWHRR